TISYKGMGVFSGNDANTPTQLWIAGRYMESLVFLAAPLFFTRKINTRFIFIGFITITSLALLSIFYFQNFPACFIEGKGLTTFKKRSEYLICFILLAALWHLIAKRELLAPIVLKLIAVSLVASIISELCFTFYVSVYGLSNILGHYFKILSVYCLYRAIIETGLSQPYALLFKELKDSERALKQSEETLLKNEKRFRVLYEEAPLPYQSLDFNGYFLDVNQAWLDTLGGYTKDEIVGKSFGDFLLPEWKEHFQTNFPHFKDKGEILGIEFEMLKKDGSAILVHFNGKIGYDEQGKPVQTHCIFQDITQQRKNEEIVHKGKEEWEKTFDAMSDIVTIQDK
ncbi:MAG: PAS domain S-box protein, partial [Desulfocapsa sp.]|nr:PAS domain S-box protein [Desulfocapsa sp.]